MGSVLAFNPHGCDRCGPNVRATYFAILETMELGLCAHHLRRLQVILTVQHWAIVSADDGRKAEDMECVGG